MARGHARIKTTIWKDESFIARTPEAQRVYFMLLSQPGLSFCGVIDYTGRRWAALAKGTTAKTIAKAVDELAEANFVVLDEDHEELWVRSFVRHDGVLSGGPKLLSAMWKDFAAIASPMIRDRFLRSLPADIRQGAPDTPSDTPSDDAPDTPPDDPSDTDPDDDGIPHPMPRGGARPLPSSPCHPAPSPAPAPAPPADTPPAKRASGPPAAFPLTDHLRAWAGEHVPSICDERRLQSETERFLDHHRAKGSLFKDWDAAWRKWMRGAIDYGPRRVPNGAEPQNVGQAALAEYRRLRDVGA